MSIIVGKYQIVKVLGKGSFGKVVLAKKDNVLYAIKTISKARLQKQDYLIPYLQGEIQCMQAIKSDYVMNLIEVTEDEDNRYLVCQYCNGGNLLQYQYKMPNRVIPLDKTLQIISHALKGLQQLHQQQYLHRDLKSQNILVKVQNKVETFKLADFGFAKKQEDNTGTILGTGKFMAPQIYKDQKYGYGVDMWAIGVIVYFMLNNQYPFNPTPKNQIRDIKSKCPFSYESNVKKTNKKLLVNCTPQTEQLFRRIFQFDPEKRMTFHQIKQFPLFKKFFEINTKAFTSSSILYNRQFKGRNAKPINHKNIVHEQQQTESEYKSNIVPKTLYKKQIQQLQFHHQHKQFLFGLSQYFRTEDRYLVKPLKMALRYNLLKLYIIQAKKLQLILNKKKLPEQVPKNLNWEKFFQSKEYKIIMQELKTQILNAQGAFQTSYNDCKSNLDQIEDIIKDFSDTLKIDINQGSFDEFKKPFRATTSYANKILNQIQNKHTQQKKEAPKLTDLRIRVFICHIINQVFIKTELLENFSYYFEWKKTAKVEEQKTTFNFESFKIWMSQQQKSNLVKTINVIFKKYFG